MNKYKCDKTSDYTHVSMYPYGGLYKILNKELDEFYNEYLTSIRKGVKLGILERPKDIGPMLVDIDIAKETDKIDSLYTKDRVIEYVKCFLKYLTSYTGLDLVDCYVLEKPAYMNKGKCKNGFHLHFPTVWMSRAYITKLVKKTNIEQEFEILNDSAVRNNWFLYGSRKAKDQKPYKISYVVNTDGTITTRRSSSTLFKTLSIRNNPTKTTTTILEKYIDKPKPKTLKPTTPLDDSLLTRCMEALDPSRADDYHDWIKIGCTLYTIDKENGLQRWNDFSKQSYKYDEDYLNKTWSRFKDYNYTIGTLIFLAKQDDKNFSISKIPGAPAKRPHTRRQLIDMCRERKLHNYMLLTVNELCEKLNIPFQKKNEKYEKHCRGMKRRPMEVVLVEVTSLERKTFKSIYSAAKSIGRNPGSIHKKRNTKKTLKSKVDTCEYTIETSE